MSPFHSYPGGQKDDNEWGAAVALLKTASGSPYYFNFHYGDLGNAFICGPSGAGKTVLLNFMLSQLEKHDPHVIFLTRTAAPISTSELLVAPIIRLKREAHRLCAT